MLSKLIFVYCISSTCSSLSDETLRKLDGLDRYFKHKRDEMEKRSIEQYKLNRNQQVMMEGRAITQDKLSPNNDIITSFEPQKYVMNIEDSVDERWGGLCAEKRDAYIEMYNGFDSILQSQQIAQHVYASVSYWFTTFVSDPYKEEIEFFSNCTGVPLAGAITLNLMEIFLIIGCTSIVAAADDNSIFHGRNLDLWLDELQPVAENLAFMAQYKSAGVTVFEGHSFFGYSGMFNGVKPSQFSISVNSRYTTSTFIADSLAVLQQGYVPMTWMIRDTLLNSANYHDALDEVMTTAIIVPAYFTIAGMYYPDGAVITRNFTHTVDLTTLDNTDLEWFVAVTNHDFWDSEENQGRIRRAAAIENMNIITRSEMNSYNMFLVMRQVPTTNYGTVSTSVFSASSVNDSDNEVHRCEIVRLTESQDSPDVVNTTAPLESITSTALPGSITSTVVTDSIASVSTDFDTDGKDQGRNKNVGFMVAAVIIVSLIVVMKEDMN